MLHHMLSCPLNPSPHEKIIVSVIFLQYGGMLTMKSLLD